MATCFMSNREFEDSIRQFVADGLSELDGEDRAWAERRIIPPRPIDVAILNGEEVTVEAMWLVTDFVDDDLQDYRLVFDPALTTFGLITPGPTGQPVLIGLYGAFAETVRGL
jgi:hypothetical protein